MTNYEMNAEPGRYEIEGKPLGMSALVAAWHDRRAQQSVIAAEGHAMGRAVVSGQAEVVVRTASDDVAVRLGAGGLGIEGQKPGVEVSLPELLIPAAIIVTGGRAAEGQLIEAVALPWFEIIKALERDPDFLHQLDWRKLEELIAGAYKREGWPEVVLTPRSGDGGRDIIASRPDWGTICFYDQVKAYSPGHTVPANDVRALYGVLNLHQNVSKAIITTTTLFAPGVYEEFNAVMPNRLDLRDGPKLIEWFKRLG
jgi:restriction system protein